MDSVWIGVWVVGGDGGEKVGVVHRGWVCGVGGVGKVGRSACVVPYLYILVLTIYPGVTHKAALEEN